MPRQADKVGRARKKAFLTAFARLGFIGAAARAAKVSRTIHYEWLRDPEYRKEFDEAQEVYIEGMESEADRRAVQGTDRPVFHKGEQCGAVKEFSDTLLIFRLKALRPEVYRELREVKHSGGVAVEHRAAIAAEVRKIQDDGREVENRVRSVLLDAESGGLGQVGQPALANGGAPRGHRSSRNGHRNGRNGKHPGGAGPASTREK